MHTCLALDPSKGFSAQPCSFRQEPSLRNYHGKYVAVKKGFTYQGPDRKTNNAAVCTPTAERNQKQCSITVNVLKRPYLPLISLASVIYSQFCHKGYL